jgi:putative metallohydrolase (TIGR04338 family)
MATKVRDTQRSKVYAAEAKFRSMNFQPQLFADAKFNDIWLCQNYVNRILDQQWFRARFGERQITVDYGRNGGMAYGSRKITLGVWARQPIVILHEIAHCVAPYQTRHGAEFAGIFLFLVKQVYGAEAAKALRACYKEARVKTSNKALPKPVKVLSAKQKIALAKKKSLEAARQRKIEESKPLDFAETRQLEKLLKRAVAANQLGEPGSIKRRQALAIGRSLTKI